MGSYNDIAKGKTPAEAADIQQIINAWSQRANIPQAVKVTDPVNFGISAWNTDAGGRAMIAYAPDGVTVLLQVDATGAKLSPDGTAAVAIAPKNGAHMTALTVDSGGLTVTAGGATVTAGGLTVTAGNLAIGGALATWAAINISSAALNASGGNAFDLYANATRVAQLNNDSIGALNIAGTWNPNSKTGVNAYGIYINALNVASANTYLLWIGTPTGAAGVNEAIHVAGGNSLFDGPVLARNGGANIAQAGAIRMCNNNLVSWRNAANNDDDQIGFDNADRLFIRGIGQVGAASSGSFAVPPNCKTFLRLWDSTNNRELLVPAF